jgi:hypothetical protein
MSKRLVVMLSFVLSAAACGDGESDNAAGGSDAGAGPVGSAAGSTAEGDAGGEPGPSAPTGTPREKPPASAFEELLAYDWELEPGEEQYYCVFKKVEEDMWVTDFDPIQPPGTHHVTLGYVEEGPDSGAVESGDPDADFNCNGLSLGDNLVYSAVFNTPGFTMPAGVAAKVPAGKKLLLSVHAFNGTDATLTGRTGIKVVEVEEAQVAEQAENVFALNPAILVEPGKSTHVSECTMPADGTLLALNHHMHLTGVRQKTTLVRKNGDREVLLDAPFDFDNQDTLILDPPVEVYEGDHLEVECEYDNPTAETFTFGESTGDSEMCLTGFYRYPAVAESFFCGE